MHRAGLTRRGFLATCAGFAAAAATVVLWRYAVQPAEPTRTMAPVQPIDERADSADSADSAHAHPPLPKAEPTVRVRVQRVREDDQLVLIGEDGQWLRLWQADTMAAGPTGDAGHIGASAALRAPVRMGTIGWSVTDSVGFASPVTGVDPFIVRVDPAANADAEHERMRHSILLGTRHLHGELHFVARTSIHPSAFDIVNHVPLETYLPGVVSKELYSHWHDETHRAQAIAARSFACAEYAFFRDRRHFDLSDNQSSQVYGGATSHRASIDAVAATHGQVLAHEDLLVPGYYSSCCGGIAAAAPDAIGPNPTNAIAPLLGQPEPDICDSASVCTWQAQRPVKMTTQRVTAWARKHNHRELAELDTLAAIEAVEHNPFGRPTRYALTDVNGQSVQLAAEQTRFALNHAELGLHRPARLLRSSHFTAEILGDDFLFRGHGYGHGVGMCQHGAQIRARLGADHREILAWYYPGAEVVTAYGGP